MKYMRDFKEEPNLIDDNEEDSLFATEENWNDEQKSYLRGLIQKGDTSCIPFLNCSMSIERFEIIHQCSLLGEEYLQQIVSRDLTDEEAKVVLFGYCNELNVFTEVTEGEDLDNLKKLIELMSKDGVDINDYFDENGEYLDYQKIRAELN